MKNKNRKKNRISILKGEEEEEEVKLHTLGMNRK